VWLEAFAAGFLLLGLAFIMLGAHMHANHRALHVTRKNEITRFIPPKE
jgi:hypothetical protein